MFFDLLASAHPLLLAAGAFTLAYLLRPALFRRGRRPAPPKLPAPFRVRDVHVIDGDTLACGDLRVRLFGMDAPEADHPQGIVATRALRQLVTGKTLRIIPRDIDAYGRLVALVHAGTIDVSRAMVASGHALAEQRFSRAYVTDEKHARRHKQGLWSTGRIDDPKAWRENRS